MICVLGLAVAMVLSVGAFAGPSLNPWLEINVPDVRVAVPTLDAGATVEGMLSQSWFIDLGFTYFDANLLNDSNKISLGWGLNPTSASMKS